MYDIEVSNLKKTFGRGKKKLIAVDDVSFKVKKGEVFGLLGVNGAGKTTTINMITGLLKKDDGTIKIMGRDPEKNWEFVRNRMNASTAYYPLSDVLTIKQNLRIYARIYKIKNREGKINELLEQFELKKLANKRVVNLSSGEKTRTALCKGLINDPKVLFLDECTVGLDPDIAEKTRNIIKDYQVETGATILFTSHYMYEMEKLCDRIAFMEKGNIMKIATADELKRTIKDHKIEISVKDRFRDLMKLLNKENVDIMKTRGDTIVFQVTKQDDKIYKVMSKIFKEGFMLRNLHIHTPTLEDVFIDFARRK